MTATAIALAIAFAITFAILAVATIAKSFITNSRLAVSSFTSCVPTAVIMTLAYAVGGLFFKVFVVLFTIGLVIDLNQNLVDRMAEKCGTNPISRYMARRAERQDQAA